MARVDFGGSLVSTRASLLILGWFELPGGFQAGFLASALNGVRTAVTEPLAGCQGCNP